MKVATIFATVGPAVSHRPGRMILPQLEESRHGEEGVGMFFFEDNTYLLRKGDPIGERLVKVAAEKHILLMCCNQCCCERDIADNLFDGVLIACFPDLSAALGTNPPDQFITLQRRGASRGG